MGVLNVHACVRVQCQQPIPLLLVSGSDRVDELEVDGHESPPGVHLVGQQALHLLLRHGSHTADDLNPLSGKGEGNGREREGGSFNIQNSEGLN